MSEINWIDKRENSKEWEEEFGETKWNSKEVDERFSKKALSVLWNVMQGRKVSQEQRKAAEFVAVNKAWPSMKDSTFVNINVLRLQDLEQAKLKAGLVDRVQSALSSPQNVIDVAKEEEK